MSSFEGMLLVLSQFGFISQTVKEDGTLLSALTLKGRIAKEVDIFISQLIVEAVLDPLDYAELAALLSAFVCDFKPRPGKGEEDQIITPIPKDCNFTSALTKAIGKTLKIVQEITREEEELEAYFNFTRSQHGGTYYEHCKLPS
jgi:superfamily II RNA helicase